jgi:sugar phosphate isomerase/epimerase
MTRRSLVGSLSALASLGTSAAQQGPQGAQAAAPRPLKHKEWRPRLGVLGPYTPANVEWAKQAGFSSMILRSGRKDLLDPETITDAQIETVKATLSKYNMHVSAFQVDGDHINPDPARRERVNTTFVKTIELAGKLGVQYIGTQSGKDAAKSFPDQVSEIVRVYNEKYFPACQRNHVRILWEPWPDGPNIATSPVGFHALFTAFGDSPYVGLQYDPSHLLRQFMDPVEAAREFVDKIYDVHLKDTEILWPVVRAGGINPVNKANWWRYRIPGMGTIDWRGFFSVLQDIGYDGAMSVEQEDDLYGADNNPGPDFSADFKVGFVMAKRYLDQYIP